MTYVDSNNQLISCSKESESFRKNAEARRTLYHYCSLPTLDKILNTKSLLLNAIKNYDGTAEYEKRGILDCFLDIVFIACFSNYDGCDNGKQDILWNNFGDNHSGVRLKFNCNGPFHKVVIDERRPILAYAEDGTLVDEYGFYNVLTMEFRNVPNKSSRIVVELNLLDVEYTQKEEAITYTCDNAETEHSFQLDISNVSRDVPVTFADEYETRLIGILRSVKPINTQKDISYLLVPIDFSRVTLEFGCNVDEGRKRTYNEKLKECKKAAEQCQP